MGLGVTQVVLGSLEGILASPKGVPGGSQKVLGVLREKLGGPQGPSR